MYGSETGVILPQGNQMQTLAYLSNKQERKAKEAELEQRRLQERQDQLVKYITDEFDFKHFGTGTAMDEVITSSLKEKWQKYAGMLKDNPNASLSSIAYDVQRDISEVTDYSNRAKRVSANIKASAAEFGKDGNIDVSLLAKNATVNAFFNTDPRTGTVTMKKPEEINPDFDYTGDVLQNNPERVVTGMNGFTKQMNDIKGTKVGNTYTTDHGGIKRKQKYAGELLPYQELQFEDKANTIYKGVKTKTQKIKIGDQEIEGLDEGAYGELFGNVSNRAMLDAQIKKAGYKPTEEIRRAMALQLVNSNTRGGGITTEDVVDQDAWLGKVNAGITINVGGKEKNPTAIHGVLGALGGNPSYLGNDKEVDPATNTELTDITSMIPGGALFSGKVKKSEDGTASKEAYAGVLIDPKTKTIFTKDVTRKNSKGQLEHAYTKVKPEEEKEFFRKIGEANGMSADKAAKLWEQAGRQKVAEESKIQSDVQKRKGDNFLYKIGDMFWNKGKGKMEKSK